MNAWTVGAGSKAVVGTEGRRRGRGQRGGLNSDYEDNDGERKAKHKAMRVRRKRTAIKVRGGGNCNKIKKLDLSREWT